MLTQSMLLPLLALVLAGCAATSVTQQGAAVELVNARPAGCKPLGEVIGKQAMCSVVTSPRTRNS